MGLLLIDTDIASFVFKKSDYAEPYLALLDRQELALSFMTIAELFQWAMLRQWGDRRLTQLEDYLGNYLVIPNDHIQDDQGRCPTGDGDERAIACV